MLAHQLLLDRSSAYREARPRQDSALYLQEARSTEEKALQSADSYQHYEDLCMRAISGLPDLAATASKVIEDMTLKDVDHVPEGPVSTGDRIGLYSKTKHHVDGMFSTIYRAIAPDGEVVALKVTVPSAMTPPHNSEREIRILKEASGWNVIPLLDVFRQSSSRLVLVFPFKSIDLEHAFRIESLPKESLRPLLEDIFCALDHIHSLGIIHRDIKPSNILLDSPYGPAYLADFGIAWSPQDSHSEPADRKITDVGTTSYRPPELLFGHTAYGCKLDIWAMGCVVAEAVNSSKRTLFDSGPLGSELALLQSIFTSLGTPDLETWPEAAKFPDWGKMDFYVYPPRPWTELLPDASEAARDLVSKLLRFESGSRLTAAEARAHAYFREK